VCLYCRARFPPLDAWGITVEFPSVCPHRKTGDIAAQFPLSLSSGPWKDPFSRSPGSSTVSPRTLQLLRPFTIVAHASPSGGSRRSWFLLSLCTHPALSALTALLLVLILALKRWCDCLVLIFLWFRSPFPPLFPERLPMINCSRTSPFI